MNEYDIGTKINLAFLNRDPAAIVMDNEPEPAKHFLSVPGKSVIFISVA